MSDKKEPTNVEKLLIQSFLNIGKIGLMGERLEKEHDTKMVLGCISLVAENGEAVFVVWNTEKTAELLPSLMKNLSEKNLEATDEFRLKMGEFLPFCFLRQIKEFEK